MTGPGRFAIIATALAGLACSTAAQTTSATSKWQAPPDAANTANSETQNPAAASIGRKRFMRACVTCHQEDGRGQAAAAANLRTSEAQAQSDGALFWKISNGNAKSGMPSFASLPETDRWDIVIFLRTLKNSSSDRLPGSSANKEALADTEKQKPR